MIETGALLGPFNFDFMRAAFAAGVIAAVPTALLSCFLVVRGWALLGDAVSHAVLPGVVLAYVLKIPLILGAFAAGMACALASGYLAQTSRVKPDTVMAVVFSGMFAAGLVLYAAVQTSVHLDHILFGDLLGVDRTELWTAGAVGGAVALGLLVFWRNLLLQTFDPSQARVIGLPVQWLHYGLLAGLSLTVVTTLTATGLILSIGLLIAPGAIARLVTRTFAGMMHVAVAVNVIAMIGGVYLSFFLDSAPAPTVILMLAALFAAVFVRRLIISARDQRALQATPREGF